MKIDIFYIDPSSGMLKYYNKTRTPSRIFLVILGPSPAAPKKTQTEPSGLCLRMDSYGIQPFSPPACRPETKYFWHRMNTSSTGRRLAMDMANT